jgi:hypothetical protein
MQASYRTFTTEELLEESDKHFSNPLIAELAQRLQNVLDTPPEVIQYPDCDCNIND